MSHIEKGMTNKKAADKFGVSENTTSAWIENWETFFQALEESSSSTKKLCGCQYEKVD